MCSKCAECAAAHAHRGRSLEELVQQEAAAEPLTWRAHTHTPGSKTLRVVTTGFPKERERKRETEAHTARLPGGLFSPPPVVRDLYIVALLSVPRTKETRVQAAAT